MLLLWFFLKLEKLSHIQIQNQGFSSAIMLRNLGIYMINHIMASFRSIATNIRKQQKQGQPVCFKCSTLSFAVKMCNLFDTNVSYQKNILILVCISLENSKTLNFEYNQRINMITNPKETYKGEAVKLQVSEGPSRTRTSKFFRTQNKRFIKSRHNFHKSVTVET